MDWSEAYKRALLGGQSEFANQLVATNKVPFDDPWKDITLLIAGRQWESLRSYTNEEVSRVLPGALYDSPRGTVTLEILRWWIEDRKAIQSEDLEAVEFFRSKGYWDDTMAWSKASSYTDPKFLEYLTKHLKRPWPEDFIENYNLNGKCVRWALENGCPPPLDTKEFCFNFAKKHLNLSILPYLIEEKRFEYDDRLIALAASRGSVPVVKFLLSRRPMPDLREVYKAGFTSGRFKMWKWIFEEQGIHISRHIQTLAAKAIHLCSLKRLLWLQSKGCLEFQTAMLVSQDPRIKELGRDLKLTTLSNIALSSSSNVKR